MRIVTIVVVVLFNSFGMNGSITFPYGAFNNGMAIDGTCRGGYRFSHLHPSHMTTTSTSTTTKKTCIASATGGIHVGKEWIVKHTTATATPTHHHVAKWKHTTTTQHGR